jgi:uncharacterized protein
MADPIHIDRSTARRFFARRHFLAPPRSLPADPSSVLTVVERLGSLQFDPLEIAGRNHDVVLLSRVAGYRRAWTDRILYEDRDLYETYNKGLSLVPTAEMPWYRITWDRNRAEHDGGTFDEHAPLVEELLERIRAHGPLSSTDIEPRAAIEWYWRPTNQVRAVLEALGEAGILGLSRRDGNRRVYDLIERLFPAGLLGRHEVERDQRRHKLLSRYRAHGLLGRSGSAELWYGTAPVRAPVSDPAAITRPALLDELLEAGSLTPLTIDGVRGERYLVTSELSILEAVTRDDPDGRYIGGSETGVAFLAPLDPFVWDRDFLRSLFDFDYVWEVYVPEKKRRWGYYVLPVLWGDRLVGRIEPRIDRKADTLRILGLWWEPGFDPLAADGFTDAFVAALRAHQRFGAVRRIILPRTHAQRPFVAAVRDRLGATTGIPAIQEGAAE